MEMKQVSASELLEHIQRENAMLYKSPSYLSRLKKIKEMGYMSEEWYHKFVNECKNIEPPNQYQDIAQYATLRKHFDEIWSAILGSSCGIATPNGTPVNGPPVFGTIFMNQFSAQVRKHTLFDKTILFSPESIVLVSNELLNYAKNLASLIAEIMPVVGNTEDMPENQKLELELDKNKIIKNAKNNKRLKKLFCHMILEYFLDVNDNNLHNLYNFTSNNMIASELTNSFIVFIFSHEFAHIVCGHMEDSSTMPTEEYGDIRKEWIEELEADLVAFNLAVKVIKKHTNIQLGVIGIFLCFDTFMIFDRLNNLKLKYEKGFIDLDSTHPPGIMRRMQIMDSLEHNGSSNTTECINAISYIIDMYLTEFERIFENCKKKYKEEFTLGDIQKAIFEYYIE